MAAGFLSLPGFLIGLGVVDPDTAGFLPGANLLVGVVLVGQVDVTDNIEANKVVDDSSSSDSEDSVVEHKELIETQREIIEEPVAEFESNIKSESESYIAYETVDETQVMDEGNTECFDQQEDVVQPHGS